MRPGLSLPSRAGFGLRAACLALLAGNAAEGQTMQYTELLDESLSLWTIENTSANNFRMVGDVLEVREPEGWLKSTRRFGDFELVADFRFMTDDADSGVFVRARGELDFVRGWPNESYQVQLRNPLGASPFPPVGGLFRHGMANGATSYAEDLAREASRATGEWQTLIVRVEGDVLSATLNGEAVLEAGTILNRPGYIGLQGETGVLEFRSLRIRELDAAD